MTDEPDLRFSGFSLWIEERQIPDVTEFWDGNWLMVRAQMKANGAHVECLGPILMTADIKEFRDQLVTMDSSLAGKATLKGFEPNINVVLMMQKLGHVKAVVEISADHIKQYHRFTVELDQSYLPKLIRSCDAILCKFPVIGMGRV